MAPLLAGLYAVDSLTPLWRTNNSGRIFFYCSDSEFEPRSWEWLTCGHTAGRRSSGRATTGSRHDQYRQLRSHSYPQCWAHEKYTTMEKGGSKKFGQSHKWTDNLRVSKCRIKKWYSRYVNQKTIDVSKRQTSWMMIQAWANNNWQSVAMRLLIFSRLIIDGLLVQIDVCITTELMMWDHSGNADRFLGESHLLLAASIFCAAEVPSQKLAFFVHASDM